jgi:hypothetical protein
VNDAERNFSATIKDLHTNRPLATAGPFHEPLEAWRWLRDKRRDQEDQHPTDVGEYSQTYADLDYIASGDHKFGDPHDDWGNPGGCYSWGTRPDGTGAVPGDTPSLMNSHGETPDDDLGIGYYVERIR